MPRQSILSAAERNSFILDWLQSVESRRRVQVGLIEFGWEPRTSRTKYRCLVYGN